MSEDSLRVAVFVASLSGGGAERVAIEIASGLSRRNCKVDLIVCNSEGPLRAEIEASVRLIDLSCEKIKKAIIPLRDYFADQRPQVAIAIDTDCNIAALLANALTKSPVRVIATVHNVLRRLETSTGGVALAVRRFLIRRLYPKAFALVGVSEGALNDYRRLLGERAPRCYTIANPVYSAAKLLRGNAPVLHPWLNDSIPVVLAAGRLVEAKGFDVLISAFARVRAERNARLVIIGDGPLRGKLDCMIRAAGIQDSVSLPGFATNPYAFMKRADVFVLSSRWEGFGLVLVEALAFGTPVVSTNCRSGPAEILGHGEFGYLVPVCDETALANAIIQALDEPDDYAAKFARKARAQQFGVDEAVNKYEEIIRSGSLQGRDCSIK